MSIWILLAAGEHEAHAVRLETRGVYAAPPGGQGVDVHLEPKRTDTLALSTTDMANLAYRLITREGISRSQLYLRYALESGSIQAKGRSADLAFLLAHLVSVLQAMDPSRRFPAFAATGRVDDDGQVLAVESVPAKVNAARDALASDPDSVILIPRANWNEAEYAPHQSGPRVQPVETVYEALEHLGIHLARSWLGCPYRGLEHFGFEHRAVFFGRDDEVQACLTQLSQRANAGHPGLLVLGASGSGKSSFLEAGVLAGLLAPPLEQGHPPPAFARDCAHNLWRPAQVGDATEAALVQSLLHGWSGVLPGLDVGRLKHLDQVMPCLLRHMTNGSSMLWVIDQLEELFTTHTYPHELLERFGAFLLGLQQAGVWVLASLRDDYLAALMRVDSLRQWLATVGGTFYLKPLSDAAALNAAITRPAAMAGLEFETNAQGYSLAQQLQEDALGAADPLPLVEYSLLQLYQGREGKLLTWETYAAMGGLVGAIGQRAEAVYIHHPVQQSGEPNDPAQRQATLRRLLRALANSGDGRREQLTARVVPVARFDHDAGAKDLIDALVSERLLVRFEAEQGLCLRVAHEAFLSQWPTAWALIEQDKNDLQRLQRLETAFDRWLQAGQPQDLLLPPGLPLSEAVELRARWGEDLDAPLHGYIQRSAHRARRGTLIRNAFMALLALLVVIASGGFWWADRQTQAAQRQALIAQQKSLEANRKSAELAQANLNLERQTAIAYAQTKSAQDATRRATDALTRSTVLALVGQARSDAQTYPNRGENLMRVLIARKISESPEVLHALQTLEGQSRNNWISLPLSGHRHSVTSVAFSPDGKRMVSGSDDRTLRLWDTQTGAPVGQPLSGHTHSVTSVALSPDGKRIVSGSMDNTLRLWDAQTGRPIHQPLRGHKAYVSCVAFSPDGTLIASGSFDETLRLWDARTGRPIGLPLQGHELWVNGVAFSPDGKHIASASGDGTLRLWDTATGQPIGKPMKGRSESFTSVAFSPDGRQIVTASDEGTLRLWDVLTSRPVGKPLQGHRQAVSSVAFSPDGKRIVSGGMDRTLRLWDAQTGRPIGQPLLGHEDDIKGVAFSPDGKRIASASFDNTLRLWDTQPSRLTDQPLRREWQQSDHLALSPDGRRIVSTALSETLHFVLQFWDARTGQPVGQSLQGHKAWINHVAISPDGRSIATASDDKTLRLWDAHSGRPIGQPLTGHQDKVTSVAFSPDGKRIASGSEDRTLRLWDAHSGSPIGQPLTGHQDKVTSVAFSPNGQRIVSASEDGSLFQWDAQTGRQLLQAVRVHETGVHSIAFSPDGRRIVTGNGDHTLRLLDARTGRPIGQPLRGHMDVIASVAFSPDGRHVASGSDDTTLRLWDAQTGRPIGQPLQGHKDWVTSVAFSPDGKQVVSGSDDETIRLWPVLDGWVDALCTRLTRNPTQDEWRTWVGSVIPYTPVCPRLPVPKNWALRASCPGCLAAPLVRFSPSRDHGRQRFSQRKSGRCPVTRAMQSAQHVHAAQRG